MKILVINGTNVKGCTYNIKELFLQEKGKDNEIEEFYLPKDLPHFCVGCKQCFFKHENLCPHSEFTMKIWQAMLVSDLIVFAYPVYALRAPGSIKSLLDHLCVHWMVHRPDKRMFSKRAIILTNSIGAPNGKAQKDVKTSLNWMGVSSVKSLGFGLMEGVIWDELSEKRKEKIANKTRLFAQKHKEYKPAKMSIRVKTMFALCKIIHASTLKKESTISADNQHYIDNGWIKGKEK